MKFIQDELFSIFESEHISGVHFIFEKINLTETVNLEVYFLFSLSSACICICIHMYVYKCILHIRIKQ